MKLTLPIPPSVNHLYGRNGWRTYVTPKGQAWFDASLWYIKQQLGRYDTIKDEVTVSIKLYVCGRYDLDNVRKAANDLLMKAGIIEDDNQIYMDHGEKIKVAHRKDQKVEIIIMSLII